MITAGTFPYCLWTGARKICIVTLWTKFVLQFAVFGQMANFIACVTFVYISLS